MASAVTATQVATFEDKGFIVLDDVLSPTELESYGAAVDAAVAKRFGWDQRKT